MDKLHKWQVTPKEAIEIQKQLRSEVKIEPLDKEIKYIGGADISLNRFAKEIYAGIVVFSYPDLKLVEMQTLQDKTDFPYIPGLLSFREAPALIKVWEKLKIKPDVLVVDGQGIAHPRRLGIASHIGVLLDISTIGCAKSVLTGVFDFPENELGSKEFIYDKYNPKEKIGTAYRSKKNSRPLIISPGHKVSLEQSVKIVENCLKGYRLPEPTRYAHIVVNEARKEESK